MMRTNTLLCTIALLFCATMATAQPLMDTQRYKIDYVKKSHLLRKGNQLTVVHFDFEWPERLSGMPTKALQKKLCQLLFQNSAGGLKEGVGEFLRARGEEIEHMPDEAGLDVNHIQLLLQGLAWEKDKYISMRAVRKYRKGDQEKADSIYNDLLTYDIVADKVLQTKEIIWFPALHNYDANFKLASLIIEHGPGKNGNKIQNLFGLLDFDYLPDQACLMPMGVLFNLPGYCDENGVEPISIVPMKSVEPFLRGNVKKTLEGKSKARKDKPEPTLPVTEPRGEEVDIKKVYLIPDEKADFPGEESVVSFLNRQVEYPVYEKLLGIQGKVVVTFVVERDGTVSDPIVILPVSPGIDRQAVNAVMDMPRWKPAVVGGQPVRSRVSIPVMFKIKQE